jgi:hypothetical protein
MQLCGHIQRGQDAATDDGNIQIYPNGPELLQPADVYLRLVGISRLKRAMRPPGERDAMVHTISRRDPDWGMLCSHPNR